MLPMSSEVLDRLSPPPFLTQNPLVHTSRTVYKCIVISIVGHQSAKTAKSAKSAKFFIQRKTAKKFWPHLAD